MLRPPAGRQLRGETVTPAPSQAGAPPVVFGGAYSVAIPGSRLQSPGSARLPPPNVFGGYPWWDGPIPKPRIRFHGNAAARGAAHWLPRPLMSLLGAPRCWGMGCGVGVPRRGPAPPRPWARRGPTRPARHRPGPGQRGDALRGGARQSECGRAVRAGGGEAISIFHRFLKGQRVPRGGARPGSGTSRPGRSVPSRGGDRGRARACGGGHFVNGAGGRDGAHGSARGVGEGSAVPAAAPLRAAPLRGARREGHSGGEGAGGAGVRGATSPCARPAPPHPPHALWS